MLETTNLLMEGVKMDPLTVAAVGTAYALLEYWLGKTDKVKPGSLVEVVLTGCVKILKVFKDSEKK